MRKSLIMAGFFLVVIVAAIIGWRWYMTAGYLSEGWQEMEFVEKAKKWPLPTLYKLELSSTLSSLDEVFESDSDFLRIQLWSGQSIDSFFVYVVNGQKEMLVFPKAKVPIYMSLKNCPEPDAIGVSMFATVYSSSLPDKEVKLDLVPVPKSASQIRIRVYDGDGNISEEYIDYTKIE